MLKKSIQKPTISKDILTIIKEYSCIMDLLEKRENIKYDIEDAYNKVI